LSSLKDKGASVDEPGMKMKGGLNLPSESGSLTEKKGEVYSLVFREISKCFQYILKYYEIHKSLMDQA